MYTNLWKCIGLLILSCICLSESTYLGKLIGKLNARGSNIAGEVYAVDSRTLHLRGLEFDGQDPDAVFFAGSSPKPSADGFVVPNERGTTNSLARYNGEQITLTLPEGKTLKDVRWISLWSRSRGASLADVKVPTGFDYPKPQKLSALNGEHLVGSDRIVVVDAQTFLIPNFTYDGAAPDALFWIGKGAKPSADGTQIPDENGNLEPLKRYDSKTLVLTLPGELTVFDADWLSIWCRSFFVDFGHIRIPKKLNVPPSLKMLGVAPQTKLNCEVLFDELALEVRWALAGESIVMQLVGKLEDNQYMSFGLSGDTNSNRMVGGDVIVAWYDRKTGKGHAEDYFLGDKSQCAGSGGVCPDSVLKGGSNNVRLLNTAVINDFVMVTYQRPLRAADAGDKQIFTNQSQAVIWALGPLNSQGRPSYHKERTDRTTLINFGRQSFWNCPYPEDADTTTSPPRAVIEPQPPRPQEIRPQSREPVRTDIEERREAPVAQPEIRVQVRPEAPVRDGGAVRPVTPKAVVPSVKPWHIPPIPCHEPEDHVFYVHIGPTGGDQGYTAITGHVGWGIAWYVNGLLIPEITVVRGTTYNFVVEGGNDVERPAKNHPFYITDDPEGGYAHKTPEERGRVKIFAGVRYTREGKAIPTGSGRLCEWQQTTKEAPEKYTSFGAYQRTLKLNCEEGQPAIVKWRPDENTPDTVYYQCFTHRYLGYRIRVVDRCDTQLQNRRADASNGQQDIGEEDYDVDFEVDPADPLRVGQSQNRPAKPSTVTHNKGEEVFTGFEQNFPEFPNFGDFPSDFDDMRKDDFFGREKVLSSGPAIQDAPSSNDLPILRPGIPKPPPLQKVPIRERTSERTISKPIGELPLAEASRPPQNLPAPSSPKSVEGYSSTEKIQDERYKKYNMQIDKSKVNNFEEPAYDDEESVEVGSEPPRTYNARPKVELEASRPETPKQYERPNQQIAPSAVDTSFNPSSIVFESGFKPIKNANGPIPPLGFEVSDQSLAGSIRKTVEPAVKTAPFSLDPVFKASELEAVRKDGTIRNVPQQPITEGRPQFVRDRETFRLDAVPPPAQVNFAPERPAGEPVIEGFVQGIDGKYYLTANQPGHIPPRPNGVKIIEKPVNKRKETKKPSFFESVGSFFGFGADKRQDRPQRQQGIPPLPSSRPGVQILPQSGEFLPPPPAAIASQPNRQILKQPQLAPFKGELPPPVPVNPGSLPQFQPQPGRPLSAPRPPGPLLRVKPDDEVFRDFVGENSRQVRLSPEQNEGFSQVMNAKISFGGSESAGHRGTVENVRIAARQGLPFSRSMNLDEDLILGDVLSKIKATDEGPEEQFNVNDREERKLRVRRQEDTIPSEDLPLEHRGLDYEVEGEVDLSSSTTTTTVVPSTERAGSSASLRSLSLLVLIAPIIRAVM